MRPETLCHTNHTIENRTRDLPTSSAASNLLHHHVPHCPISLLVALYWGIDICLARPRRKQAPKQARDARDFNNIETLAVFKVFLMKGREPKDIHAILTETLVCFLRGRAKVLSEPLRILRYVKRCMGFVISSQRSLFGRTLSRLVVKK